MKLIIDLALDPDYESQILIQKMAESELEEALMIFSFNAKIILLNICNSLSTSKMILGEIALLVFSK